MPGQVAIHSSSKLRSSEVKSNDADERQLAACERIPFNRPFVAGREFRYISEAVSNGNLAGDGTFTKRCSDWMVREFGAKKVLLTHSCTAALEMAAMLGEVGPGDEVIMPSYTFVSTASAFALRGAGIRFVDIREDTLNIDEKLIESAITEQTKAIVPVHYAGVGAEMDTIMEIADRHDLLVIEDAAQGVCSTYKGRYLGTLGHLATYSFHETKNLISGEGGALVVNDSRFLERAEVIRDKGTNRSQFTRGLLEESKRISAKRRESFDYYMNGLRPLEERGHVRLPVTPKNCRHVGHMFYVILESTERRAGLIAHLDERGIQAVFHYVPLHSSPMGKKVSCKKEALPITDAVSERLLRLPCFFELTHYDQDRVVDAVSSFFEMPGS
jgi:dTDP-4-amino-4,6-dideoxygalactose transaminase